MSVATQPSAPHRAPSPRKPEDEAASQARERLIDEELDDSFPASDPPSWVQGTTPARH